MLQRLCNHLEQLKPDPQPPKDGMHLQICHPPRCVSKCGCVFCWLCVRVRAGTLASAFLSVFVSVIECKVFDSVGPRHAHVPLKGGEIWSLSAIECSCIHAELPSICPADTSQSTVLDNLHAIKQLKVQLPGFQRKPHPRLSFSACRCVL